MSRIIAVADGHGNRTTLSIASKKVCSFDRIIFLGDYFTHDETSFLSQKLDFLQMIELKKNNPDKVVILIGNHEANYLLNDERICFCRKQNHEEEIKTLLYDNITLLDFAWLEDHWLFTHAGMSSSWLENMTGSTRIVKAMIEQFKFNLQNKNFSQLKLTKVSNDGEDAGENPLWIRPCFLRLDPVKNINQVVGHTSVYKLDRFSRVNGDLLLFLDSDYQNSNVYAEIDTNSDFFCINEFEDFS